MVLLKLKIRLRPVLYSCALYLLAVIAFLSVSLILGVVAATLARAELVIDSVSLLSGVRPLRLLPDGTAPVGFETPPLVNNGGQREFVFSTSYSYRCFGSQNPTSSQLPVTAANCSPITAGLSHWPDNATSGSAARVAYRHQGWIEQQFGGSESWAVNYNGIYGLGKITRADGSQWLLGLTHTETKNELRHGMGTLFDSQHPTEHQRYIYLNPLLNAFAPSIYPSGIRSACRDGVLFDGLCYSGYNQAGVYNDEWPMYTAFVATSWNSYSQQNGWGSTPYANDRGPVIWPEGGYLTSSGGRVGTGVRHPSMLIETDAPGQGWIYVFYTDDTGPTGIATTKAARCPISQGGLPGCFHTLRGGAYSEPALPAGFAKEQLQNYLGVAGPMGDNILPLAHSVNRFSVARATWGKGQRVYLGAVEFRNENTGRWEIGLTVSTDLVRWSPVTILSQLTTGSGWNDLKLHYPLLVNSSYTSHNDLALTNFVLAGAPAVGTALPHFVRLKVTLKDAASTPGPTDRSKRTKPKRIKINRSKPRL